MSVAPFRPFALLLATLLLVGQGFAEVERRLHRSLAGDQVHDGLRRAVERLAAGRATAAPRAIPVIRTEPATEMVSRAPRIVAPRRDLRPSAPASQPRVEKPVSEPAQRDHSNSPGAQLVVASNFLATKAYPYVFGGETPEEGGFDCSGVVHYLLNQIGVRSVPRVAYDQYRWLESEGTLTKVRPWTSPERLFDQLKPGDLLFWTGTYQTGRNPNISHVMVYMGSDLKSGEALMFGARSSKLRGGTAVLWTSSRSSIRRAGGGGNWWLSGAYRVVRALRLQIFHRKTLGIGGALWPSFA